MHALDYLATWDYKLMLNLLKLKRNLDFLKPIYEYFLFLL